MSGPRILMAVGGLIVLLAVLALREDDDRLDARGREETEIVFGLVEDQLHALQDDWDDLKELGPVLGLRKEHDYVRTHLSELRARAVEISDDPTLDASLRLAASRELVHDIDQLLGTASMLRRQIAGRARLVRESNPLLIRARDLLAALQPLRAGADAEQSARIGQLASHFVERENMVRLAMKLMQEDVLQGEKLAANEIKSLASLVEQLQALRRDL